MPFDLETEIGETRRAALKVLLHKLVAWKSAHLTLNVKRCLRCPRCPR
jgi:hypothetical protein